MPAGDPDLTDIAPLIKQELGLTGTPQELLKMWEFRLAKRIVDAIRRIYILTPR